MILVLIFFQNLTPIHCDKQDLTEHQFYSHSGKCNYYRNKNIHDI